MAAPDILVVCLSNVSLFLSGGPRPTHQIRGNCWGQGLTQDIATVGGRIGDESNQWRLLPLVPRRSQQKETNQRTATAEQRGQLRPTFKQIGSIQMSVNSPSRSPSNLIFFSSLQPVLLRPEKRNKRGISRLSLVVWIGQRDPNWKPVDLVCFVVLYRVADVRYRRKEWFVMQTKSRSEWQYVTDRFGFSRVALSIPSRHKPSINWAA